MTDTKRPETLTRQRRDCVARLSVSLPRDTLMRLKIHAAQHETTIRDVVTDLITKKIAPKGEEA